MGTSEIIQALHGKNKELTAAEINELVDTTISAIHVGIRRLLKDCSVNIKYRHLTYEEKLEKYGHPIGRTIKIYWLDE